MEKKLSDYLHLYLGVDCVHPCDAAPFKFIGINEKGKPVLNGDWSGGTHPQTAGLSWCEWEDFKPLLRSLSSMTEEEKIILLALNMPNGWQPGHLIETNEDDIAAMRIFDMNGNYKSLYIPKNKVSPNNFLWLIKNSFDLFDLIPSGLAIDSTTQAK